jgi:hypothetical protein
MPSVSGTITDINANPIARVIRAYRRDTGALLGEATSHPTTGAYSIDTAGHAGEVQVVMLDDIAGSIENDQILRTMPL